MGGFQVHSGDHAVNACVLGAALFEYQLNKNVSRCGR
jgi:hypothetical protein